MEARLEACLDALAETGPPTDGWHTFVGSDDAYQVDLPPGTRLTTVADGAYVVSTEDPSAMPIAILQVLHIKDRAQYGGNGEALIEVGDRLCRLYPRQHEPWPPFVRVAASF